MRKPTLQYLVQTAHAAEQAGFLGALIPTGTYCEDAWLVATAIALRTRHFKPLVAFRPGFVLPAVSAQMAASFQRLTGGRLLLNVVTGGDAAARTPVDRAAFELVHARPSWRQKQNL